MTDATQAILPVTVNDTTGVTEADRIATDNVMHDLGLDSLKIMLGLNKAFARHRQAHSLPGDVGMREALNEIRAEASGREPLPLPSGTKESHRCVATALAGRLGSIERKARAALAPSALSGDAGEGE